MADPIYLIRSNKQAVRMEPTPYAQEEEFQEVLEEFPELLAGEQIDRKAPRRWLMVAREMPVPDSEVAGGRWSVDHFFVDQDGIPTLVEVKRQSDTRIRREVVGQVLEYAANAALYWPTGTLQKQFEETCKKRKKEPGKVLDEFLASTDYEQDDFWRVVGENLSHGRMRLIFLADDVPKELQRIVEFLNSQMQETEVLAIEVKRYAGDEFSTHVPRLLGQTAAADAAKESSRAGTRRKWDQESYFSSAATQPEAVQAALRKVYDLAKQPGFDYRWGTGATTGSLNIIVPSVCPRSVISVLTTGELKLNFEWLPPGTQTTLGTFARNTLGMSLPTNWENMWPGVMAEKWVPHADALAQVLKGLTAS